jgi:hypothetical protein
MYVYINDGTPVCQVFSVTSMPEETEDIRGPGELVAGNYLFSHCCPTLTFLLTFKLLNGQSHENLTSV